MKSALRCVGKQPLPWPISAVLVVAPPALRAALLFISISAAVVECKKDKTNCRLDWTGELSLFLFAKPNGCSNAWEYTKLGWFSPGAADLQGAADVLHAACGRNWRREADPATASSRGLPSAAVFPALQSFWRVLGKRLNCWLGFQKTKSPSWSQWWWQGVYKYLSLLILK